METCIEYTDGTAWISSDERKWINRVHKLKADRPDEVQIKREPENNDGCIYATVPAKWVRVSPPKVLSEEHKAKLHAAQTLFGHACSEPRSQTEEKNP